MSALSNTNSLKALSVTTAVSDELQPDVEFKMIVENLDFTYGSVQALFDVSTMIASSNDNNNLWKIAP